jgi:acyl dehydratase
MNAPTLDLLTFDDVPIGRKHSIARTISAADVDAFGQLSGDLNPLHMDDDFARRTPFKRRVVHGLLTGALVSTTHTQLTGPGFAYVGQELRFLGPVFIGDTLNVEVTRAGVHRRHAERRGDRGREEAGQAHPHPRHGGAQAERRCGAGGPVGAEGTANCLMHAGNDGSSRCCSTPSASGVRTSS